MLPLPIDPGKLLGLRLVVTHPIADFIDSVQGAASIGGKVGGKPAVPVPPPVDDLEFS